MKTRVISAVVMLAIVALCMLTPVSRLLLVLVCAVIGLYEMSHVCLEMDMKIPKWRLMGFPVVNAIFVQLDMPAWCYIAFLIGYILFILSTGVCDASVGARGTMMSLFTLLYPESLFCCIMFIIVSGNWAVVCSLAAFSTWFCDAFALFGGKAYGRHRLSAVSPNKTWEGAVTGAVCSLAGGLLCHFFIPGTPPLWQCLAVSLFASTMGQFGDLAASLLKREAGIKDYSHLIPGHGGILDRVDSLLFSIPSAWFLLEVFDALGA